MGACDTKRDIKDLGGDDKGLCDQLPSSTLIDNHDESQKEDENMEINNNTNNDKIKLDLDLESCYDIRIRSLESLMEPQIEPEVICLY
jgi:hypothetical protein